jgi:hypothetical protein
MIRENTFFPYAALDASSTGSGAGPQIYAENVGIGSSREPREMMMPIGSVEMGWIYGFFICMCLRPCHVMSQT